uniref:Endonuclease/exonuclease/phosphatase domain-containing protein n=1 Tax=Amphiprion percula TaxID=161767 RepID=A0A3P8TFF4_AMPPE
MTSNNVLKLASWNVMGAGSATKLGQVMTHLDLLKGDEYFLQETHMLNRETVQLRKGWVGEIFHSTFNSKARVAAILICRGVSFTADRSILDPYGRYLMVSGRLQDILTLFVCVYGPNLDDSLFITSLFPRVNSLLKKKNLCL